MADDPQLPDSGNVKQRLAALEKTVQLLAKGLLNVDSAIEDWEGERVVPAGEIAGIKFPGA